MKRCLAYNIAIALYLICWTSAQARHEPGRGHDKDHRAITPGAERTEVYLPGLKGKRVALLINQTSRIGNMLLLDSLLKRDIKITKVFVPEHGFRGQADAGAKIKNDVDSATGIKIISLYGNNKKPSPEQMKDVDVLIYDLQDVGVRFYTYISTLEYAMEACAESGKQLLVLDRPNPNGDYVDGPVLEPSERSFVGMQPIPVVYGMTAGEYAEMIKGEKWAKNCEQLKMEIVPCKGYDHKSHYDLPVPPSPNLRSSEAIRLYPSLCLFEGTVVSVGRGTDKPFRQFGHPSFESRSNYFFIPKSGMGSNKPPLEGEKCYGEMPETDKAYFKREPGLDLDFLLKAYQWYPDKSKFFNSFFERLAGTKELREQIEKGMTARQIRESWEKDLDSFKKIRAKYLIYTDFD
jgi:uncharacterized protein YbbC (DUF1343 family)